MGAEQHDEDCNLRLGYPSLCTFELLTEGALALDVADAFFPIDCNTDEFFNYLIFELLDVL